MAQLRIPCPHCHQVTSVDESKLPDKPVSFACPHCKGKVHVDKAKLMAQGSALPAPAPVDVPSPLSSGDADGGEDTLPPGASFPPGIITGDDPAQVADVRGRLERHGATLQTMADAEECRGAILLDPHPLVVYVAGAVGAPPYAGIQPIVSVPPADRRRVFVLLVADDVRTLDGNAAYMYQVNLCVNRADLGSLASTLYGGLDYHHRLYRNLFAAMEI